MVGRSVSFREAARFWLRFGFVNFGGPAGQIAMMQTELVDRRRWIDAGAFLGGLNFCMLLPGPEAQQLATYLGWRIHGLKGALTAGIAFVAPGTLLMLLLAWIAAAYGEAAPVAAVFAGVAPTVVAIVAVALVRIAKRTLHGVAAFVLALAAFIALFWFKVPFPAVVLGAGVIGLALAGLGLAHALPGAHGPAGGTERAVDPPGGPAARESARLARIAVAGLALWAIPVALAIGSLGWDPWADVVRLFTTAAFVTFGGAYAVLPYIAEAAVGIHGWLDPAAMTAGLALAESTPGPLILVTVYVGFFAGWNAPGALPPELAGALAGLLTAYVTFLPSIVFILAGGPHVERLQANPRPRAALGAITAAVVGVILNLGVFLGRAVLWPEGAGLDLFALGVALAALALGLVTRISIPALVGLGAAAGLARWALAVWGLAPWGFA